MARSQQGGSPAHNKTGSDGVVLWRIVLSEAWLAMEALGARSRLGLGQVMT